MQSKAWYQMAHVEQKMRYLAVVCFALIVVVVLFSGHVVVRTKKAACFPD